MYEKINIMITNNKCPPKKRCPDCGQLVRPGSKHGKIDTDFKIFGKMIECKRSKKHF